MILNLLHTFFIKRNYRTKKLHEQEKNFWWLDDKQKEDVSGNGAKEGSDEEGDQDHVRLKQTEDGTFEMIDSVDFENLKKEVQENSIPEASRPYHEQFLKYAEEHNMDLEEARERYDQAQQREEDQDENEDIRTQENASEVNSDELYGKGDEEEYSEDFEGSGSRDDDDERDEYSRNY